MKNEGIIKNEGEEPVKEQQKPAIQSPEKGIEELKIQIDEYKELLQRVQADFENYKKRCEKAALENKAYSNSELIAKLLPVLDSFDSALKNTDSSQNFAEGVKGIYAQLLAILEGYGLRKIYSVGKQFDPYLHEVLLISESDKDNIILEELQKGYMIKEAVIRHSKVKIGKATKIQEDKNSEVKQ